MTVVNFNINMSMKDFQTKNSLKRCVYCLYMVHVLLEFEGHKDLLDSYNKCSEQRHKKNFRRDKC